jgi:hypothetical protein
VREVIQCIDQQTGVRYPQRYRPRPSQPLADHDHSVTNGGPAACPALHSLPTRRTLPDPPLAAKSSAEVITALTDASGALGLSQEFWGAITSGIHYRFYPRVLKQAMAAAAKIEQSGLPRRAYAAIPDRLLRAVHGDEDTTNCYLSATTAVP